MLSRVPEEEDNVLNSKKKKNPKKPKTKTKELKLYSIIFSY
jgi:hypothetical protein